MLGLVLAVVAAAPAVDVAKLTERVEALRLIANARNDVELKAKGKPLLAELGRVQSVLEKHADAARSFEKAVALDPKDAFAESMLGGSLMELDRGGEGVVHLEKAFALDPLDFTAAYNAAQYYQNLDQPKKALPLFEKVADGDANDWRARWWSTC